MTSKEALDKILQSPITKAAGGCFMKNDELETIKQDLEVLEILKNESDSKRITERNGIASFHLDMILTTDNYRKVKEWVEND
jgi:hypothetical protein